MSDRQTKLPSVEETLIQLNDLMSAGIREAPVKSPLGPVHSACQMAVKVLGLPTQASRAGVKSDSSVEDIAASVGLSAREITLTGNWWEADHGIFIGTLLDEERLEPTALPEQPEAQDREPSQEAEESPEAEEKKGQTVLVRSSKGLTPLEFCMVGQSGEYQPLTPDIGQRMSSSAHALFTLLPDTPLTFGDVFKRPLRLYRFEVAVYLLLTVVIALLTYAVPVASGMVIDKAVPYRDYFILFAIIGVVIVSNVMMLLLRYMSELIINRVDGGASTDLQAGFLDRVFRLPMKFLSGYNKADLMRRFTSMESTRRSFSRMLVTSTMNVVTVVVGLVTLAFYYPVGALAVGLLAALSLAASITLGRLSMKAYSEGDAMTANVMTIVYELIANMVPIRIFAAERRAFIRWRDNFVEMRRRSVRSTQYSDTFSALQQSMGLLTLGVVFTLVSYYTDNPSASSVGHYVAFVGSISLVTGSVSGLASSILGFFSLQSSVGMSGPLLKELPEPRVGRRRLQVSACEFQLENVEFKYSEDSSPVFENFSLHIKGGEYLGIVGASGCGKSTLLKLLLGIHKPSSGTISIDGVSLADVVMDEARKSFGVVLQDYRMVPGSILENISAGRHLELDAVMTALKTVGLDALIKALPMGIHTMVGEGNSMFSGGQMQLMALARALSGDPKLLIFDEATSALDNMSVKKVGDAIDSLAMTRIVFTHRLGTLKNCNRIIVLDRGAIVQEGTYDELSEQPGPFLSMLNGKTD